MKAMKSIQAILTFTLLLLSVSVATAAPLGTAFTYQGRLTDGTNVANGSYDLKSTVYDALADGNAVGGSLTNALTTDSNGVFTVALDFGNGVFTGDACWLQIGVRTNGSTDDFTLLSPRQPLTPAPHALYAPSAGTAANSTTANTASNLLGMLPDAQLSTNVARLNANQTFTGDNTLSSLANSFTGDGSGLTSLNASNLTTGTVAEARIDAVIARDSEIFATVLANDGPGSGLDADLLDGLHGSAFWKLSGNAATTPGVDFLGTTDNQALELKVNNVRALRLEPTAAGGPNVIGGSSLNTLAAGVHTATIGGGEGNAIGANAHRSTIGGGTTNTVGNDSSWSVIAGGRQNDIGTNAGYSAIGGGYNNNIAPYAYYSAIGGGQNNNISAYTMLSVVAGGYQNIIGTNSDTSAIVGGYNNNIAANAPYGFIGGGRMNNIATFSDHSAIGGGLNNNIAANATNSVIAGGYLNDIGTSANNSAIGGGYDNNIASNAIWSVIGGGTFNDVAGGASTISGGFDNNVAANAAYCVIGGGSQNYIATNSSRSTIAGGVVNYIGSDADNSAIGGGYDNDIAANATNSVIAGGRFNDIGTGAENSAIGGGYDNNIAADATISVIAGGRFNDIGTGAENSAIGGGYDNNIAADATFSTIAGGYSNNIGYTADLCFIGGGKLNVIGTNSYYSTIGGGQGNTVGDGSATFGTIAGGQANGTGYNASYAAIGGGYGNQIGDNCSYATIPGGLENYAAGNYSFAAGRRAKANHTGAFVWGDGTDDDVASAANHSVTMRAQGGYRLFSNSGLTAGVSLAAGGGSWTTISDRNAKQNFQPVDPRAVLDKVAALPVSTWSYKSQDAAVRHIGPVAQDFKAAFGVGESDTGITSVDADGVALAAIQGLNQIVKEKEARITDLEKTVAELKGLVSALNRKVNGGGQ